MRQLTIGDVTIRASSSATGRGEARDMFPAYDPEIGRRHLAALDRSVRSGVRAHGHHLSDYVVAHAKHTSWWIPAPARTEG